MPNPRANPGTVSVTAAAVSRGTRRQVRAATASTAGMSRAKKTAPNASTELGATDGSAAMACAVSVNSAPAGTPRVKYSTPLAASGSGATAASAHR